MKTLRALLLAFTTALSGCALSAYRVTQPSPLQEPGSTAVRIGVVAHSASWSQAARVAKALDKAGFTAIVTSDLADIPPDIPVLDHFAESVQRDVACVSDVERSTLGRITSRLAPFALGAIPFAACDYFGATFDLQRTRESARRPVEAKSSAPFVYWMLAPALWPLPQFSYRLGVADVDSGALRAAILDALEQDAAAVRDESD